MKKPTISLFLMIGFFTRLPVPKVEFSEERFRKSMALMPLVGLIIGAILALIQFCLVWLETSPLIVGGVLTGAYIFLTGGLHLEGLGDTCDGVFSGRSREQSLEIMKDSRIGVFGTLGIFMTGLMYFALFTEIPFFGLLVFPVIGRACCLISATMSPYARKEGMGKAASSQGGVGSIVSAVISIGGASLLANLIFGMPITTSIIAASIAVLVTVLITLEFKKKLGGVTGDTFGAAIEVASLVYMFAFILIGKGLPL